MTFCFTHIYILTVHNKTKVFAFFGYFPNFPWHKKRRKIPRAWQRAGGGEKVFSQRQRGRPRWELANFIFRSHYLITKKCKEYTHYDETHTPTTLSETINKSSAVNRIERERERERKEKRVMVWTHGPTSITFYHLHTTYYKLRLSQDKCINNSLNREINNTFYIWRHTNISLTCTQHSLSVSLKTSYLHLTSKLLTKVKRRIMITVRANTHRERER